MHYLNRPGFQPIRHLLLDSEISEIMINGPRVLFVERQGVIQQLAPVFPNAEQLEVLVDNLVVLSGRAVNARTPFMDMRLPDGARVNIVVAPAALDGPVITIRKATRSVTTLEDLVERGTCSRNMAIFLCAAIQTRLNIVFCGGTATGKTTTLGILSAYIDPGERILVIEDTAELELRQPHVVRLEGRPAYHEDLVPITLKELVTNSLRMRPTRIIVGEVRGDEAFDMVNAMSSGHDGCLAVVHATSPWHAISRIEMMMLSRGLSLPMWAIQRQIAGAVHLVVQHALMADGSRRITHVTAVGGASGDQVELLDLFEFDPEMGGFRATGKRPPYLDRMSRAARTNLGALLDPRAI